MARPGPTAAQSEAPVPRSGAHPWPRGETASPPGAQRSARMRLRFYLASSTHGSIAISSLLGVDRVVARGAGFRNAERSALTGLIGGEGTSHTDLACSDLAHYHARRPVTSAEQPSPQS